METILLIFGLILALTGVIGSFFPALPGPLASYMGLLILYYAKGEVAISATSLILVGLVSIFIVLASNLIPIASAKITGATKYGIVGSFLGMLIGLFLFPPFGVIAGTLIGAILGEFYVAGEIKKTFKASLGTLLGIITVSIIQISFTISIFIYIIIKTFNQ